MIDLIAEEQHRLEIKGERVRELGIRKLTTSLKDSVTREISRDWNFCGSSSLAKCQGENGFLLIAVLAS